MVAASSAQVLPASAGWATVIALGIGFAFLMIAITYVQERYTGISAKNNEEFSSASRSVKTGLIASGIVSAWTWAATLLQSSTVAFKFGVAGPYAYAAGATIQVLLFSMMATKTKINAPFASTYLQVVRARWGKMAHIVFLFFGLCTNVLVSSMLILGGSATVHQLTGMPIMAAIFLTPVSVAIYTAVGGMRSTLLADYSHTTVLLVLILTFAFTVYAVSPKIGSPQKMAELLAAAPPVVGNAGGSYLTMRSMDGLKFGIINICGNLATVFADQSYHQRGIASASKSASKAFILGGLAWFAVPMLMASSMGLAARALTGVDPAMAILSSAEISAGLAAPAAAVALLGKSGGAAMLVLLYLAVTSASSAQLIAVSSVLTYDLYQPYISPKADAAHLLKASHAFVAFWAVMMGVLGLIWYYIGVSMGWLYVSMGIIVAPAVFPIFACISWEKTNKNAAVYGSLIGVVLGVMSWLVSAKSLEGGLSIATTSSDNPLLVGNIVSLCVPMIITIVGSYIAPDNYDWAETRAINAPASLLVVGGEAGEKNASSASSIESPMGEKSEQAVTEYEGAAAAAPTSTVPTMDRVPGLEAAVSSNVAGGAEERAELQSTYRSTSLIALGLSFVLIIFVPCMSIIAKTWSGAGLGAWVGISIAWMFCSCGVVIVYPVYESREALGAILRGMAKDLSGGNGKVAQVN